MLTPVDIENKEFTKAFRGYDIYEVEEFMKSLVTDYEKLYRENAELKNKNASLAETIDDYKGMKETMQNAILVAQRTAEDIKQNAYERAETIIKDAERRAAEVVDKANRSIINLEKNYLAMQREMNSFKAKMASLLSTYMQMLEDLPEQPAVNKFDTAPIPKPIAEAPAPLPEEEIVSAETMVFDFPLVGEEPKAAPAEAPAKEEPKEKPEVREPELITPAQETTPAVFDEPERKLNPVVEELLRRKREEAQKEAEAAKEAPAFSVTKETISKEDDGNMEINVDNLQAYDVFSDNEL